MGFSFSHDCIVSIEHVGAEEFARLNGCEMVDVSYFRDENRLKQLKSVKAKEEQLLHRDCKNEKEGT